jgi:hypothetical protein
MKNSVLTPSSMINNVLTTNCNTKMFDPSLSNIDYECSGLCPPVYSGVGTMKWYDNVPAGCNVTSTNGPNVVLVSNESKQVSAISSADSKTMNKYVCPTTWNMSSTNSSMTDTTSHKSCYCKMGTSKKSTQTSVVTPDTKDKTGKVTKKGFTTYTTKFTCQ